MRIVASIAAWSVSVLLVTGASAGDGAEGQSPGPSVTPAYRLSAEIDVPLLLVPGVLSAAWLLSPELEPPYCAPRCDPATLNFIDEPAAGLYSTNWSHAGSVATVGVLASMPVILAFGEEPAHALNDLVVIAQATLFASATQVVTSFATSRPRPRLYGDLAPPEERNDGNAARSFFSGHTATGFAATVSTFRTLLRVKQPALAWTALGLGGAGSTFLSVARVGAGSHFPTDVAAGAVVGCAFGFLVPALHSTPSTNDARRGPAPVHVRVLPMAGSTAGGASVLGAF